MRIVLGVIFSLLLLGGCASTKPRPTQRVSVIVTEACVKQLPDPLDLYTIEQLRELDDGKRVLALYVNQERLKDRVDTLVLLLGACLEQPK